MSMPVALPARLQWFYEGMKTQREASLAHLPAIFTSDIVFRDPFRDTKGLEAFRELFTRMFWQYRHVDFTGFRATGTDAQFTLTYDMRLRMVVGPTFVTPMASICSTRDGLISEVVDYYDFPSALLSPLRPLGSVYRAATRALFL